MKPILVSHSDSEGGAARAAFRLHQGLLSSNVESKMQVAVKKTDLTSVNAPVGMLDKLASQVRPYFGNLLMRMQKTPNSAPHSPNFFNSNLIKKLNQSNAEVLNLHWVNNELISIEDIGHIQKPMVWTLHDMWGFCGAEHYASEATDARWRKGYLKKNRSIDHTYIDIDRWVWRRKKLAWNKPIHIVTPSNWLADCVRASALMQDWPVTVIPNPIDTRQYQPWSKKYAREILGLPLDVKLVMFGAIGGCVDFRKGWDLLQQALAKISVDMLNIECVIFGQSAPVNPLILGLPIHWMGHVNDDVTLALLYSAVDVMVVPSRQENLPQAATEAQSCGCPVVAFDCTGMPSVVEHKQTGYLATPYDSADLAEGILWVLMDEERCKQLSVASRQRALDLWSVEVVVPKYLKVYETVISFYNS